MKGFVFEPSRLARSRKQQEREGYAMAGRLLREHLGGDPLAELRRRARRDPVLRAMFAQAAAELLAAAHQIEATTRREGGS
jgi:hypothetical protein